MPKTTLRKDQSRHPVKTGTTSYWDSCVGYVPDEGEIIVYSDYASTIVDGNTVPVPGIKIGSGNGYVQDLAFVGQPEAETILSHIQNDVCHITAAERTSWNKKLNVDDLHETDGETLIFIRN